MQIRQRLIELFRPLPEFVLGQRHRVGVFDSFVTRHHLQAGISQGSEERGKRNVPTPRKHRAVDPWKIPQQAAGCALVIRDRYGKRDEIGPDVCIRRPAPR